MATYLVTGGCGFIGSHLCEALRSRGEEVRVLDDLSTGSLARLPAGAHFIQGDVADPHAGSSCELSLGCPSGPDRGS